MLPVIEKSGMFEDMKVLVTFLYMGHRCGYVGVPEGQLEYEEYRRLNNMADHMLVHGGVTFLKVSDDFPIITDKPFLWIGFDCAHSGDSPDIERAEELLKTSDGWQKEHLKESIKIMKEYPEPNGHIWTTEEVWGECLELAKQVKEIISYE